MITMEMIGKIRRMYVRDKLSLHEIAKRTGLSRNTIRKWVRPPETVMPSASSINDISSSRRGGLRSHSGPGGRTLAQLRNEASQRGLPGRSRMNKAELEGALKR